MYEKLSKRERHKRSIVSLPKVKKLKLKNYWCRHWLYSKYSCWRPHCWLKENIFSFNENSQSSWSVVVNRWPLFLLFWTWETGIFVQEIEQFDHFLSFPLFPFSFKVSLSCAQKVRLKSTVMSIEAEWDKRVNMIESGAPPFCLRPHT